MKFIADTLVEQADGKYEADPDQAPPPPPQPEKITVGATMQCAFQII